MDDDRAGDAGIAGDVARDADGDAAGDVIGRYGSMPPQIRKRRSSGWTAAARRAFLTELAHSCNVGRAHVAAGMGPTAAYGLRRRDPEFAAHWQEALMIGYDRLDMALLRRALETVGELEIDEREEMLEKMSVAQAIDVMNKHRQSVLAGQARPRGARRIATQEETDAVLIKRIAMVKRQRARLAAIGDSGALLTDGRGGSVDGAGIDAAGGGDAGGADAGAGAD
ncbi:MAG: hypothetical protein U0S50_00875 [Sphingopyxis sp.]|uniref:hypothetical protein n=1 Tax=Sphingopyxis sp. TaxID=1908224 RepID=UPI002AB81330|nr:hypothetical protein [Sphingopyxis sp.]MDZ3830352.1 hypothetical protein [Sphingopyxis sp.]